MFYYSFLFIFSYFILIYRFSIPSLFMLYAYIFLYSLKSTPKVHNVLPIDSNVLPLHQYATQPQQSSQCVCVCVWQLWL